ncbi:MAG: nitroreductase family protein [Eubacteriales bacterium]|jgi:nitroreductase|nr:nitroreductase family protein [Eubacteriales bacterium]
MNDVLRTIHERKSVRVFEPRPISAEDKEVILLAAMAAPTAGNQQLYTILDITDRQLLEKLAVTCDNQPFIAEARMALIFLADQQKWIDAYRYGGCTPRDPGPGDFILAVEDACIAAQNAVIAAQSLGVGSCYIGDIMERCEEHRAMLGLSDYVFPAAMLVFGYPTAQQLARPKPHRRALKHIVHENHYRRMDKDELVTMLREDGQDGHFDAWIQAFCRRKYNSDFSIEMSRSVAKYLESYGAKGFKR